MKTPARVMLVFSVLLAAATLLFVFSGPSNENDHSVANTKSGGLAAFAELLRDRGHTVVMDRRGLPRFQPGDFIVRVSGDLTASDLESGQFSSQQAAMDRVDDHINSGATCLEFRIGTMPKAESGTDTLAPVRVVKGNSVRQLSVGAKGDYLMLGSPYMVPVVKSGDKVLIGIEARGEGTLVTVAPGHIATNRYIAKGDNAEVLIGLIDQFAPPKSRIVFPEALIGNVMQTTELDDLGPWANSAKWQFFLLVAVVVWSLGFRFGALMPVRAEARNTKEVLDAMASTLQKAKRRDHALFLLLDTAFDRIRTAVQATAGTKAEELTKLAGPRLATAINQIRQMYGSKVSAIEAQTLARELESALQEFEGEHRSKRVLVRR